MTTCLFHLKSNFKDSFSIDPTSGQIISLAPLLALRKPVLVIRHGETKGNLEKQFQGQSNKEINQLNDKGKEDALRASLLICWELTALLGNQGLTSMAQSGRIQVLSSPLGRSLETMNIFMNHFSEKTGVSLSHKEDDLLKEMSFGPLEGKNSSEIKDPQLQREIERFRTHQDARINWCEAGESFIDLLKRAYDFLNKINASPHPGPFIVFTHGFFISALRGVLGESSILSKNNNILFRDKVLSNGTPYWLGDSREIALHGRLLNPTLNLS